MNTISTQRLNELRQSAESRGMDTSEPYAEMMQSRDTAAALAELIELRTAMADAESLLL